MKIRKALVINIFIFIILGCISTIKEEDKKLIDEIDKSLRYDLLDAWYPVSMDTVCGGFFFKKQNVGCKLWRLLHAA